MNEASLPSDIKNGSWLFMPAFRSRCAVEGNACTVHLLAKWDAAAEETLCYTVTSWLSWLRWTGTPNDRWKSVKCGRPFIKLLQQFYALNHSSRVLRKTLSIRTAIYKILRWREKGDANAQTLTYVPWVRETLRRYELANQLPALQATLASQVQDYSYIHAYPGYML